MSTSVTIAVWVALGTSAAQAHAPAEHKTNRIVAVGDLHGDLGNALDVLRLAKVIDQDGKWSGGNTILVQTGDTTDRGPDGRAIMALLRRLSDEAKQSGGRVVALLGNHEVMNMTGDWRYVTEGDVAAYGGAEARRAAFSPDGEDGRWLRTLNVAEKVGDTVFVHGGVAPELARGGLDALNADARRALRDGGGDTLGSGGPLWYRGFALDPPEKACPALKRSLDALDAKRMVVGHTTRSEGTIGVRCEGALHMIDVGIATHYGSHVAAWESIDGDARALYPHRSEDLEDPGL